MRFSLNALIIIWILCLLSCKEDVLPKPKGMLRLEYESGEHVKFEADHYEFQLNNRSFVEQKDGASITIDYPRLKGSIFMTYKAVDGNLARLLSDAQKLSYEHVVKADNIVEQPFVNELEKVYGMYYEVRGNAASQSQFYVTDSVNHFVTGSLYFYTRPNYDSIYPAAIYVQDDIRRIMETMKWK